MKKENYKHDIDSFDFISNHSLYTNNKLNESRIEQIATCYRQCKIKVKSKKVINISTLKEDEEVYSNLRDLSEEEINKMNEYIKLIDEIVNSLGSASRLIMLNNYFQRNNNKQWWIPFFTRSSYYRKKEHAMIEFLSYVE